MSGKTTWTEQAKAISFDPSGLVVVKGINVQAALAELDNYVSGLAGGGDGPGSPGADGESAYQIWLDLGNTGTEQDFINSLIGPAGAAGADGGIEIAAAIINANFSLTNAQTDVPGAQLVVPANSGPFELEFLGGVFGTIITGTNAANTVIQIQLQILDETNAIVAYSPQGVVATGTSFAAPVTIPVGQSFPNFAIDKTYRLQARLSTTNVGASGTLNFAGIYPARTMRAVRR